MALERAEAPAEVIVRVGGQVARLRRERERAERTRQSRELGPQPLRMRPPSGEEVAERRLGRADRMQEPARGELVPHVGGGCGAPRVACPPARATH